MSTDLTPVGLTARERGCDRREQGERFGEGEPMFKCMLQFSGFFIVGTLIITVIGNLFKWLFKFIKWFWIWFSGWITIQSGFVQYLVALVVIGIIGAFVGLKVWLEDKETMQDEYRR